jgi:hypothetical protein
MLIKDVFEQFLSEQQAKLAPKTYRDYASVIELFEHQLEGYGWNNLAHGQQAYETAQKKGKRFIERNRSGSKSYAATGRSSSASV